MQITLKIGKNANEVKKCTTVELEDELVHVYIMDDLVFTELIELACKRVKEILKKSENWK